MPERTYDHALAWIMEKATDAATAPLMLLAYMYSKPVDEVFADYRALKNRRRDEARLRARNSRHHLILKKVEGL